MNPDATAPEAIPEAVIDARWLRTGIGRYVLTLLRHLKPHLPQTRLICITLPEHVEIIAPYCDRVIPLQCGIYTIREQLRLPMIARRASVFCAPHYNLPLLRTGKMVVTIHDITHLLFPAYARTAKSRLYARPMLRIACSRASRIVVPSEYTRRMLVQHLQADARKISVVPCAVDEVFRPLDKQEAVKSVQSNYRIAEPYILSVTSAAPHKNLAALLSAYWLLRARHRDIPDLVLVLPEYPLPHPADEPLRSLLIQPGVRCLSGVPDASLAALYAAACMTVMPSFEEGFGLPVVESMACGTPVVCSNAASLPEIAGDAALFFAPGSAEEIASSIEQVLFSEALQAQFSAAGLERAAIYSPKRAAAGYASVLSSFIADE